MKRALAVILVLFIAPACGSDTSSAPAAGGAGPDTVGGDVATPSDAADSAGSVDASDDGGGASDTQADVAPDAGGLPPLLAPPALPTLPDLCAEPVPEPVAYPMDATKISLAVYHFNIQYVAGGIDDFLGASATEEEVEDAIIREGFEPLVALFERHPDWGASFEMQGLMLEIMALRHPDVARRFQKLVRRGQVDLLSFHWSDQLVTAYTRQDMLWSWAENKRVTDALCIPRAPAHFLQEGQYGPGLSAFAQEMEGATMILPRNLLKMHVGDPPPAGLIFENDGYRVLVTNGHATPDLTLGWSFVDDGELLATHKLNPYIWDSYKYDAEYLKAEYEDKLQAMVDDGWIIAPVSHYLKVLADRAVAPTVIDPPVMDGSWQPRDSDNMHIWMGGKGQVPGDERDNAILTGNVRARQALVAVSHLIESAQTAGVDTAAAEAWHHRAVRELLKAECSDTTGWRPLGTEIRYGLEHGAEALRIAQEVGSWLLAAMGHPAGGWVDAESGEIRSEAPTAPMRTPLPAAPDDLAAVAVASKRPVTLEWTDVGGEYVELAVVIPATDKRTVGAAEPPEVELTLPLLHDAIVYSPALAEGSVRTFPLAAYAFAQDHKDFAIPLPNGLLGIGPEWTLVLDQQTVHLAALLEPGAVRFLDQTFPSDEGTTWRFRFYAAPAVEVLERANRLNLFPWVGFPAAQ